jgi:hypothetical protein
MRDNEYDRLCATKKGRELCLTAVRLVAERFAGAAVELHEFNGPREVGLDLHYGPYACMMHFDGGEKIGAFLGHWHMNRAPDGDRAKTYPDTFWRVGSLNTYHKQKATTIAATLDEFTSKLAQGLELLASHR